MKLKILGLALLAFAATSALVSINASATVAGHFEHEGPTNNAIVTAEEGKATEHGLAFYRTSPGTHTTTGDPIQCEKSQYTGTVATKTVTTIRMYPKYTNCTTPDGTKVTVHVNGCSYTFSSHGANAHGTVAVDCPTNPIEITHPNCTIKIPGQTTITEGITYDTVVEGGKHALTATVTATTITGHFEGGICIFLGTNQKFEMVGSATIRGYVDISGEPQNHTLEEGAQIGITHT